MEAKSERTKFFLVVKICLSTMLLITACNAFSAVSYMVVHSVKCEGNACCHRCCHTRSVHCWVSHYRHSYKGAEEMEDYEWVGDP